MSIRDSLYSYLIKAECDGCIARLIGDAIEQNPYEEGTHLWWRFRDGWSYAERTVQQAAGLPQVKEQP